MRAKRACINSYMRTLSIFICICPFARVKVNAQHNVSSITTVKNPDDVCGSSSEIITTGFRFILTVFKFLALLSVVKAQVHLVKLIVLAIFGLGGLVLYQAVASGKLILLVRTFKYIFFLNNAFKLQTFYYFSNYLLLIFFDQSLLYTQWIFIVLKKLIF